MEIGGQVRRPSGRTVLAALAGFWTVFVAAYTLRAALLQEADQWPALERRCAVAVVGVVLAWGMYVALARPASLRARVAWTVAMSVPAAIVYACCSVLLFGVLAPMPGETCATGAPCTWPRFAADVSELMINWLFVFAAWGLLCVALANSAEQRATLAANAAFREAARTAEIRALRYQVNPHFIFNVLNSLVGLIGQDRRRDAQALIGDLATILRQTLAADPLAAATLAEEVAMQTRYLRIEERRFPGRLALRTELAPGTERVHVPALILQPLVENAVRHGVARSRGLVTVTIRAVCTDGMLVLVVADDAQPAAHSPMPGLGVGLQNVADRLRLHSGERAVCRSGPTGDGGYAVELHLPLEMG